MSGLINTRSRIYIFDGTGHRPRLQSGVMRLIQTSLIVLFALVGISHAQIREHTRPGSTSDPARARYRLGGNVKGATELSNNQASDVNLTLNEVAIRPIQTWVRTAGRIDKTRKIVTAFVPMPEASFVKMGQRVR